MARPTQCRPFNVLDGMVLVAAAAVAMLLVKAEVDFTRDWDHVDTIYWKSIVRAGINCSNASLVVATIALVAIGLRRPRPSIHRLTLQPGFSALAAVSAMLLVRVVLSLSAGAMLVLTGVKSEGDIFVWFFRALKPQEPGLTVAAVWSVQGIGRRWRPDRGWIDRCGRVVGCCWLVSLLISWSFGAFFALRFQPLGPQLAPEVDAPVPARLNFAPPLSLPTVAPPVPPTFNDPETK